MPAFHDVLVKTASFLALAALVAGVCAVIVDVRNSIDKGLRDPNDFVTLYAGAVCASSDCNPYSVPDLDAVLHARRGSSVQQVWTDQLPIYPPTTLLLLRPLAALTYRKATLVWYVLSFSVYLAGIVWAFLLSPSLRQQPIVLRAAAVVLAAHFPKVVQCLSFGNPSVIVVGLLLFATFDDPQARHIPRAACAWLAVLLKVTVALPL